MEPDPASSGPALHALFVAVDGGARAAIAPIAQRCGRDLHDVSSEAAETAAYWSNAIDAAVPALLVVGTSDSARGRRIEAQARRTAQRARLPIVAIEDFPGNYYDVEDGAATAVIVESRSAGALCTRKLGSRTPVVEIVAAARYDPYRARLDALRRHTAQQWASDTAGPPTVLWAGQPETDDCMRTLVVLLPVLQHLGIEVAFKAHPRDAGYAAGTYREAFKAAGVRYRDITASSVDDALGAAPRLVVTQFSSVAIEAGFFGIPSLWILLPDAGGARLEQKKGYGVPPLALAGGAAMVGHAGELEATLDQALHHEPTRVNLMACFDDYFAVRQCAASALLRTVSAFARSEISPE
jgi:hypothetical protein